MPIFILQQWKAEAEIILENLADIYVECPVQMIEPQGILTASMVLCRCNCSPMITYHKARDNWVKVAFCLLFLVQKLNRIEQIRKNGLAAGRQL